LLPESGTVEPATFKREIAESISTAKDVRLNFVFFFGRLASLKGIVWRERRVESEEEGREEERLLAIH